MHGTETDRRRFSTRQRMIVLTFDSADAAASWDEGVDDFMAAARDVIDAWDDWWDLEDGMARMDHHVGQLRRALFSVRQSWMRDG